MRSAVALSLAALAGSALAAPAYGGVVGNVVEDVHIVVETVVHTVYVTGAPGPSPSSTSCTSSTPTPAAANYSVETFVYYPAAPPAPTSTKAKAKPRPTPVYAPPPPPPAYTPAPPPTSAAPTPTPTPSPAPAPAPSTGGYMDIVAKWRKQLGLKEVKWSAKLEANALKTVQSSNGAMVHMLNPGTMGQVLAPGKDDLESFEKVLVGGWYCEMPNLPGLGNTCQKMSEGWSYEGQTGHAKILTDPNYTEMACGNAVGIWCCDLA